jgi:hypothetical protein
MLSTNSQSVSPVKDLLERIMELKRILEDLEPNIRDKRVRREVYTFSISLATNGFGIDSSIATVT